MDGELIQSNSRNLEILSLEIDDLAERIMNILMDFDQNRQTLPSTPISSNKSYYQNVNGDDGFKSQDNSQQFFLNQSGGQLPTVSTSVIEATDVSSSKPNSSWMHFSALPLPAIRFSNDNRGASLVNDLRAKPRSSEQDRSYNRRVNESARLIHYLPAEPSEEYKSYNRQINEKAVERQDDGFESEVSPQPPILLQSCEDGVQVPIVSATDLLQVNEIADINLFDPILPWMPFPLPTLTVSNDNRGANLINLDSHGQSLCSKLGSSKEYSSYNPENDENAVERPDDGFESENSPEPPIFLQSCDDGIQVPIISATGNESVDVSLFDSILPWMPFPLPTLTVSNDNRGASSIDLDSHGQSPRSKLEPVKEDSSYNRKIDENGVERSDDGFESDNSLQLPISLQSCDDGIQVPIISAKDLLQGNEIADLSLFDPILPWMPFPLPTLAVKNDNRAANLIDLDSHGQSLRSKLGSSKEYSSYNRENDENAVERPDDGFESENSPEPPIFLQSCDDGIQVPIMSATGNESVDESLFDSMLPWMPFPSTLAVSNDNRGTSLIDLDSHGQYPRSKLGPSKEDRSDNREIDENEVERPDDGFVSENNPQQLCEDSNQVPIVLATDLLQVNGNIDVSSFDPISPWMPFPLSTLADRNNNRDVNLIDLDSHGQLRPSTPGSTEEIRIYNQDVDENAAERPGDDGVKLENNPKQHLLMQEDGDQVPIVSTSDRSSPLSLEKESRNDENIGEKSIDPSDNQLLPNYYRDKMNDHLFSTPIYQRDVLENTIATYLNTLNSSNTLSYLDESQHDVDEIICQETLHQPKRLKMDELNVLNKLHILAVAYR